MPKCLLIGVVIVISQIAVSESNGYHRTDQPLSHSSDKCKGFANYLVSIGYPSDLVPPHKLKGDVAGLQTCQNVVAMHSTCCTNATEVNLQKAAVDMFHHALRSTVDHLHALLNAKRDYFHGVYQAAITDAVNSTVSMFKDTYHLNDASLHDCIEELFLDVSSYMLGNKKIDLQKSVARFYDCVFPVVFQHLLSDPSSVSVGVEYRNCLMSVRRNLNPNPYGSTAVNLGNSLAQSALTARQLLNGLSTSARLFHTTSQWSVVPECSRGLAQLVTCAACRNSARKAKPCRAFCNSVMDGCLAGVNEIETAWDQLVIDLLELQQRVQTDDLESALLEIHLNISESILLSMETSHKYYQQIVSQCGRPSSRSVPANKISEFSSRSRLHDVYAVRPLPGLFMQIDAVMKTVNTARNIFQRLPNVLCSHENFLADDESTCWNSTAYAPYRLLADTHRVNSVRSWSRSSTVKTITEELMENRKLHSLPTDIDYDSAPETSDDDMDRDADEPRFRAKRKVFYLNDGSGERPPWKQSFNENFDTDDEDMSGSGLGRNDYSFKSRVYIAHTTTAAFDFDSESDRHNGKLSPYLTTIRSARPTVRSQACTVVHSVSLLLYTTLSFLLYCSLQKIC